VCGHVGHLELAAAALGSSLVIMHRDVIGRWTLGHAVSSIACVRLVCDCTRGGTRDCVLYIYLGKAGAQERAKKDINRQSGCETTPDFAPTRSCTTKARRETYVTRRSRIS
jgi:hypothetical protein